MQKPCLWLCLSAPSSQRPLDASTIAPPWRQVVAVLEAVRNIISLLGLNLFSLVSGFLLEALADSRNLSGYRANGYLGMEYQQ
jgi:hypothetical protein